MADITVTYNGQTILEMNENGTKTLKTAKKRCKTDIEVAYVKSGGGSPVKTPGDPFAYYQNYLRSSGTQYIDTGYKLPASQDGMRIEVLCKLRTKSQNAGSGTLFGVNGLLYLITANANNGAYFVHGWSSTEITNWTYAPGDSAAYDNTTKRLFTIMNNRSCCQNEVTGQILSKITTTYSAASTAYNLYLFARNIDGSKWQPSCCAIDLYNFKVYEQDRIAVDIVPALDDNNVPCAYDNVRGIYLYNQGTGDFVFGTDS